ncbi:jouberin-like isoform X3 [Tenebrio molitor]|uniref:jouberin-like isoform X3 n=1 Tax=Tenebrio molitor TaxID=7067 RepID=UPI0036247CCA
MASNSDNISSAHSLCLRNQTKDKFESIVKAAIQKRKCRKSEISKSKEKLLDALDSTTASSEHLSDKNKTDNLELHILPEQSKNYILNKFFDHQSNECQSNEINVIEAQENSVSVKPPVPKPRKKKCVSPTISQGTFEVTSPKIVKKNEDEISLNNYTYNIEEVGDVLMHKSPLRPKIILKDKVTSMLSKKSDTEILTDDDDDDDDDDSGSRVSKGEKYKTTVHDKIEEIISNRQPSHDSIQHVNSDTKQKKEQDQETNSNKKIYTYEKIIEIVIHKSDRLYLSHLVVHPVVKIHVIDTTSGKYLSKSDKNRSVVFFYENNDNEYISPVMTHTYNLQEKRVLFPSWEETVLLNEDYEYFKDESHHVILFFEILDFVSFSMLQMNHKEYTKGWHNIAFAFLKLSGKNRVLNVGKKMRLQLYYPHQLKKNDPHVCNPWLWWKKKKLEKYPSSLYITIKCAISPKKIAETFRSKTAIQRETSSRVTLFEEIKTTTFLDAAVTGVNGSKSDLKKQIPTWSRSSHEICKLPNTCLVKLNSYDSGCFILKFSPSGLYLACAIQIEHLFCVIIYSVLSLKEIHKLPSHQALIYNIKWSRDDLLLASASADNTVQACSLSSCSLFQILPHPSFVYTCDISQENLIASGCYDGTIRIWSQLQVGRKTEFHLFQELEAHRGYVTSLCFDKKSNIFSADSVGVIMEWQKGEKEWILKREINLLDLKETVINEIMLFPREKKLLVHSRDNTIRIIDLKSGCILQWLRGLLNKRFCLLDCRYFVLFHHVEPIFFLVVKMDFCTFGIQKVDMKSQFTLHSLWSNNS